MEQKKTHSTILLILLNCLLKIYRISPVWWFHKIWKHLDISRENMFYQNTTDVIVLARLALSIALALYGCRSKWVYLLVSMLLLELSVAYVAHFFSNRFNSAGPGKVTAVNRSLMIMALNYLSYIFLFAALFIGLEGLTTIDAVYLSTTTIATLGYGDIAPSSDAGKLLSCTEVLAGIFQLAIAFGTVVSWQQSKRSTSRSEEA